MITAAALWLPESAREEHPARTARSKRACVWHAARMGRSCRSTQRLSAPLATHHAAARHIQREPATSGRSRRWNYAAPCRERALTIRNASALPVMLGPRLHEREPPAKRAEPIARKQLSIRKPSTSQNRPGCRLTPVFMVAKDERSVPVA